MKNSCSRYRFKDTGGSRDTHTGTPGTGNETLFVGLDGCEVRLCGPCAFVRPRVPCVNVNTTDATAGATALLLPAQSPVC